MCVLAFAWHAHPSWLLVMAGNRDELHARPADALGRWDQPSDVIAGRDLESGGTWLGVSDRGRVAVVTNLRGFGRPEPDGPSRGALVTGALSGGRPYSDGFSDAELSHYNPFNLIMADRELAFFISNRPTITRAPLAPGVYGLSNGALDEPWTKTIRLKARLDEWLANSACGPETLLDDLRDESLGGVEIPPAGLSEVPQEPPPSPIFVRDPVYGTRCSTVVAIDANSRGIIIERRFDATGSLSGETALSFSWPA